MGEDEVYHTAGVLGRSSVSPTACLLDVPGGLSEVHVNMLCDLACNEVIPKLLRGELREEAVLAKKREAIAT